jgi:amino acid transporter
MDHEKPQAVPAQIFEFGGEPAPSVHDEEVHYERAPSIEEPAQVKERRERRGESVW